MKRWLFESLDRRDRAHAQRPGLLPRFHLDGPLMLGLLALAVAGMAVLFSAGQQNSDLLWRQGVRLGLGFVAMVALAQVSPQRLRLWAPWLYGIGLVLLLCVLLFGDVGKGAQRWLDLGFMRFQPSEIMKISLPMMVAWWLADRPLPVRPMPLAVAALMVFLPFLLIVQQPDLGTALLVLSAGFFVLFLAGLSWRLLGLAAMALAAAAPLIWHWGLRDYQRQRILTMLDPESEPLGAGYHIIQSKIAIGSGGMYGKGWLNGTQAHLQFLPESSTDFVFAVFAEEFGLIGSLILLAVYFAVVSRGLYLAAQVQDTFGRLLAGSLGLTFFVYWFVNIGMVMGLLPVVGLPLPMISYGGTSLVTILAGFGILMSAYTHRRLLA
jgi:rod shape determining protein RodA